MNMDFFTIVEICKRAEEMKISMGERFTLILDLENADKDVGMNFQGLLEADDLNFAHDIVGIQKHMNRTTGKLEDFFVPRYAKQKDFDINAVIDKAKEDADKANQETAGCKNDVEQEIQ